MAVRETDLKGNNKTYFLRHDQDPDQARAGYAYYEREGGIEETVCLLARWDRYVDKAGNICDVPLASTRVLHTTGPEAMAQEMYTQSVHNEHIRKGSYPIDVCPYAQNAGYKPLIGRDRLLPLPDGETPCEGEPDGCSHMKELIAARRKVTRDHYEKEAMAKSAMPAEQVKLLMKDLAESLLPKSDGPKPKHGKGD